MRVMRPLGVLLALLFLAACSTFPGQTSSIPADSEDAQIRVAALEVENDRLTAENARMAETLTTLQREIAKLRAISQAAASQDAAEGQSEEKTAEAGLRDRQTLSVPEARSNPEAVVDEPKGSALANGDVPVASSPRLVQSTFASNDAVFENEADGEIPTESVLYGVHLASYRKLEEAREGWSKLQRENPDELGLLEPRVETVSIPEKGVFVRLIGGGFSSEEKAAALCARLKPKDVYCTVSNFSGQRLSLGG